MSTSLLYHCFGLRGYRHRRTDYVDGETVFTIELDREQYRCSVCGSKQVVCRGTQERVFRSLPIGSKPTQIHFAIPRVLCNDCGTLRQLQLGFADPRRTYSRSFERYALELGRHMTIQDVAKHLGVSWDVIKDIQKRHLQRRYSKPRLKELRKIAIDEISIGKGNRFLTVVLDLASGVIVFVGDGKGADALLPFWKRLKASHAKIKAVATDMSAAYITAIREHLKGVLHVFDRFHVIKLFNRKLSVFRRQLYHELTDKLHKEVIQGIRWLLLKNPENLDDSRNERQRLERALELNKPLATVYYMKDALREFWDQEDKRTANEYLQEWIDYAEDSGIEMLKRFARTLTAYRSGLLAYFEAKITTGPLEGTNNKIKTMKRQAYGFRDREFLKLKILGIHETKYALVG